MDIQVFNLGFKLSDAIVFTFHLIFISLHYFADNEEKEEDYSFILNKYL